MIAAGRQALRRIWPPGVRAQLIAVYSAAFSVISLLSIGMSLLFFNFVTISGMNTRLNQDANIVAEQVDWTSNTVVVHDSGTGAPLINDTQANAPLLYLSVRPTTYVRILDLQGKVLYHSQNYPAVPIQVNDVYRALSGSVTESNYGNQAHTLRILTVALVQNRQRFAILQVGTPLTSNDLLFMQIGKSLHYIILVVIVLSIFAGYVLAARVFRPIRLLTRAARDLAAGNLGQRVPVPLSHDDVHTLATSFNDMAVRIQEAFTQQRHFVANASHELRTPVAAIRSLAEVALTQQEPQAMANALRAVSQESDRLGKLINTLLLMARSDEGQLELDHDPVRLDLLAVDLIGSMETLAEERGLTLVAGKLAPVTVNGDAARIIQVVMSLLENALIYTAAGGMVRITITTTQHEVLLAVEDNGMGIEADDLPHIFERFYRADQARTRALAGSGLGLALARDLATAHGGEITVWSVPHIGSTFTLHLPYTPEVALPQTRTALPGQSAPPPRQAN